MGRPVDDVTGGYYVVEQDVGVWRYGAEPTDSTLQRTLVISSYLVNDGFLVPDIEGIVIIHPLDAVIPGINPYMM
jgi:3-phytase